MAVSFAAPYGMSASTLSFACPCRATLFLTLFPPRGVRTNPPIVSPQTKCLVYLNWLSLLPRRLIVEWAMRLSRPD